MQRTKRDKTLSRGAEDRSNCLEFKRAPFRVGTGGGLYTLVHPGGASAPGPAPTPAPACGKPCNSVGRMWGDRAPFPSP